MSKTLADMTPEQRAACVGMWCEYPNTSGRLGIIYDLDDDNDPWILRFDVRIEILGYDAKDTIPRFDLPRAWNPDGTPVAGEWEWRVESTKGAEFASTPWTDEKEARDIVQKSRNALTALGIDPTGHVRIVRRLVSQPEEEQNNE